MIKLDISSRSDNNIKIVDNTNLYMNPNLLTVYRSPFPKKRIGRLCDGGYVISDIPDLKYDVLIAGGVSDDISFEEDFIRWANSGIIVHAFDGTVSDLPATPLRDRFEFTQKNIGREETDSTTNLHELIDKYKDQNVFVKMDIEGGEIPWILSLMPDHMNAMDQIVMEFHFPFGADEARVFDKINKTHLLVHFHPNNGCDHRIHNGVYMPNVFECTYLHKKYFVDGEAILNTDYIPNDSVDARNIYWKEEIYMGHPPFVHFEEFTRKNI